MREPVPYGPTLHASAPAAPQAGLGVSGFRNLWQVGKDGQGAIAGVASLPNWRSGEESWCIVKPFSLVIAACRLWSPAPVLFGAGEAAGFAVRGFLSKLHYIRHSIVRHSGYGESRFR